MARADDGHDQVEKVQISEALVKLLPRWSQQEWMAQAECAGQTRLFFPPNAERPQARTRREAKARAMCEACPVGSQCRSYARQHREFGYWGGENEEERTSAGYAVPSPIGVRRQALARAG